MVTMFDSSVFSSSKKGWNVWCVAECYSVLQRVAVCWQWSRCSIRPSSARRKKAGMNGVLLSVAACSSVLQCVVLCWQRSQYSFRQSAAPWKRAGMCGVLQSVTECCTVLQRVALCVCVSTMVMICHDIRNTVQSCNTVQHSVRPYHVYHDMSWWYVMIFDWSGFRSSKEACYIHLCSSVLQSVALSWQRSRYSICPSSSPRKRAGFFLGSIHYALYCNALQHTATHCNTLQHSTPHYNVLQYTAKHWNTFQHLAKGLIVGAEHPPSPPASHPVAKLVGVRALWMNHATHNNETWRTSMCHGTHIDTFCNACTCMKCNMCMYQELRLQRSDWQNLLPFALSSYVYMHIHKYQNLYVCIYVFKYTYILKCKCIHDIQ